MGPEPQKAAARGPAESRRVTVDGVMMGQRTRPIAKTPGLRGFRTVRRPHPELRCGREGAKEFDEKRQRMSLTRPGPGSGSAIGLDSRSGYSDVILAWFDWRRPFPRPLPSYCARTERAQGLPIDEITTVACQVPWATSLAVTARCCSFPSVNIQSLPPRQHQCLHFSPKQRYACANERIITLDVMGASSCVARLSLAAACAGRIDRAHGDWKRGRAAQLWGSK